MKVTFENNTLTIKTGITRDIIESPLVTLTAKDDKDNEVYKVRFSDSGLGGMSKFSITANAYIEDEAAYMLVMPADTKLEDVKAALGKELVAAANYLPLIAAAAKRDIEEVNKVFE